MRSPSTQFSVLPEDFSFLGLPLASLGIPKENNSVGEEDPCTVRAQEQKGVLRMNQLTPYD